MRLFSFACLGALLSCALIAGPTPLAAASHAAKATMSTPSIGAVTSTGFTVTWTTNEALNTQLHYGIGNTDTTIDNWTLSTSHSVTVTGLEPGTEYEVRAESSYYSNPDLLGAVETVTTAGAASSSSGSSGSTGSSSGELFTSPSAAWLYSAPTGTGLNIGSITSGITLQVNAHTEGFDYPVEDSTGANGCVTFTDTLIYNYSDKICVPVPASGTWTPSVGGWGAYDGHLIVLDTATNTYYDFWKLYVNSAGQPTSTNVGQIVSGNLATSNGTPGTTAAEITGLAGDIMPGELDCETCLNHALNVGVPSSMNSNQVGTEAPAVKTDGTVPGGIFREGAKLMLDPSVDLDSLDASTAAKAVLRALQLYGAVITDQTSGTAINIYSDLATEPDLTGINLAAPHLWIYY